MAVRKQQPKKNIAGFLDHAGMFHPIREPQFVGKNQTPATAKDKKQYSPKKAGDKDDVFDKEIRKLKNQKKAEQIWEKRLMDEALDNALGEESKVSLTQFVRRQGGLKFDPKSNEPYNGELENLSFKQSKVKGLAHPKGKYSLDGMREAADIAGYGDPSGDPLTTINQFLDALETDMKGKKIYPFGNIGTYKFNPGPYNKVEYLRRQAKHLDRVIRKLKTRKGSKTKIAKLENVRELVNKLARGTKPTAQTLKKNGLLTAFAELAVGTSAAVGLYDRFKEKKEVKPKNSNRNYVGLKDNKSKVEISPERQKAIHEKNFQNFLVAIESGDLSKEPLAKIQGKLAGHEANEVSRAIQYARLTYKLKQNPSVGILKQAENLISKVKSQLKINGIVGRVLARHKAGKLYKRQLRLEAAIDRAKKKRSAAEAKAKKNPPKYTAKVQSKAFEEFQGRKPTELLNLARPDDAPKGLWCLGKLFELRLKGKRNLNFRREVTGKTFYLCADEKNKQLWICGGKVATPNSSIEKGYSEPYALITHIVYETKKVHLGDTEDQGYIHEFGEEGGQQPTLAFDRDGFPIIVAGSYTITPLGIAD